MTLFGITMANAFRIVKHKPGIGSLIREKDVNIVRNLIKHKANTLLLNKTSARVLSVNH